MLLTRTHLSWQKAEDRLPFFHLVPELREPRYKFLGHWQYHSGDETTYEEAFSAIDTDDEWQKGKKGAKPKKVKVYVSHASKWRLQEVSVSCETNMLLTVPQTNDFLDFCER